MCRWNTTCCSCYLGHEWYPGPIAFWSNGAYSGPLLLLLARDQESSGNCYKSMNSIPNNNFLLRYRYRHTPLSSTSFFRKNYFFSNIWFGSPVNIFWKYRNFTAPPLSAHLFALVPHILSPIKVFCRFPPSPFRRGDTHTCNGVVYCVPTSGEGGLGFLASWGQLGWPPSHSHLCTYVMITYNLSTAWASKKLVELLKIILSIWVSL